MVVLFLRRRTSDAGTFITDFSYSHPYHARFFTSVLPCFFFFNHPPPPDISPLPLHAALPLPRAARAPRALPVRGRPARMVGEVQRVPAGLAAGSRDRFAAALDPLAKRRGRLIRQTV